MTAKAPSDARLDRLLRQALTDKSALEPLYVELRRRLHGWSDAEQLLCDLAGRIQEDPTPSWRDRGHLGETKIWLTREQRAELLSRLRARGALDGWAEGDGETSLLRLLQKAEE